MSILLRPPVGAPPRVTVLMLAYRNTRVTDAVRALLRTAPRTPYELRILLNGASPAVVREVRANVSDDCIHFSRTNLGFGGGMNRIAANGTSDYLVLLNDDAEVQEGWLDRLVKAADEFPDTAMVSSRLLYPDGRLQEAGARISLGGIGIQVGNGGDPNAAEVLVRRLVDYGSAAALLIRRKAFDQVGGFDPEYYPAYYEDADLGLRLRQAGWQNLYEPSAVAVHVSGVSSTAASAAVVPSFTREIFLRRWGWLLDPDEARRLDVPAEPIKLPARAVVDAPPLEQRDEVDHTAAFIAWLQHRLQVQLANSEDLLEKYVDAENRLAQRATSSSEEIQSLRAALTLAQDQASRAADLLAEQRAVIEQQRAVLNASSSPTARRRSRSLLGRVTRRLRP